MFGSSQKLSEQDKLVHKIKSIHFDSSWHLVYQNNNITFSYLDTFSTCIDDISPLRRDGFIKDTLKLKLFFETNWTNRLYKKINAYNQKIESMICDKVIAHYDSVGWNIKANRQMVKDNPLEYWRYYDNWTIRERKQISEVKRLPNIRIKKLGVFIDLNYQCIEPFNKLNKLSDLEDTLEKMVFEKKVSYGIIYIVKK